MATANVRQRIAENSHSIRWRLPLSYAGIALLTAVALGGLLLFTLNSYYGQQEQNYLNLSAQILAHQTERMYRDQLSNDEIKSTFNLLSFLAQARVQLIDTSGNVVADSGPFNKQGPINVNLNRPQPGNGPDAAPPNGSDGPYLSPDAYGPDAPPPQDDRFRYPLRVQRGAFGQLLTNDLSTSKRSDKKVTAAVYGPDGTVAGYLKLSEGPAFGSKIVADVAEKVVVASLIAVLIAAFTGVIVSGSISRPVFDLVGFTRRMAKGDLTVRAELNRQDEFGLLAKTFNHMAEQVEHTVNTLKQFVEDAAHEINTPITALRTNLELTTLYDMPDSARSDIDKALIELLRLEKLTRSLLTLARLEAPSMALKRSPVDLSTLIRQMNERYASRAEQAGINLNTEIPAGPPVLIEADTAQITRMLDNLLDNALKFTPTDGQVTVGMCVEDRTVRLWVQDTGIGIPEYDVPRLFSRFHRGRNAASYPGNGLGLVITKAIVTEYGGQIAVDSGEKGTRFTVHLPHPKGNLNEPHFAD